VPSWRLDPALALVAVGAIRFASPELVRLTGFTRSELTGPSFALEHLFPPGETPTLGRADEAWATSATLRPLAGEDVASRLIVLPLQGGALHALLFEPGAPPEEPPEPREAALRAARALARATSSAMAEEIVALRRLQETMWDLDHAHDEHVRHQLESLAGAHDLLMQLQETRHSLARHLLPMRGDVPPPFP
jgi:hypothetical protein